MKKLILLPAMLLIALTLAGCSGQIGSLPTVTNPDQAATVYVVRTHNPFAGLYPFNLTVDGNPIYRMRMGDYVKFYMPAGKHTIGVKITEQMVIHIYRHLTVNFKPRKTYYFSLISTGMAASIKRITPDVGNHFIATGKDIS